MSGGELLLGDCREIMPALAPFDMILADPPYSDTSLVWDKKVEGWLGLAAQSLKPTGSMWVFGSMRFLMLMGPEISKAGLRLAQDVVWEKHNGSGFHKDRFKRVHEHAVHLYRKDQKWKNVFNSVQFTNDATAKTVRRKTRPPHMGNIEAGVYISKDGGPRITRSVLRVRSCHGRAIHPTQKPVDLLEVLVRTSCPPGGVVGDFFAGAASAWVAAKNTGRRYIGAELSREYWAAAHRRMELA